MRNSPGHLTWLGVDPNLLPAVRLLTGETDLEMLHAVVPEAQYAALYALASGMTVDEAQGEVARLLSVGTRPEQVDPDDLVAAMERTPGAITFVSGPEELQLILAYPFAAWRTFLHPSQRKIAYRESYAGPAQVTGGPGTGKTVTVLHRAVFLAERAWRVLVTTFNGNLAGALRAQLDLLIRDAGVRRRIEVLNVDRLAYSIVKQFGQQVRSGAEPPGDDVPPRRFAHPPGEHLIVAPAEQRTQERPLDGLRVR